MKSCCFGIWRNPWRIAWTKWWGRIGSSTSWSTTAVRTARRPSFGRSRPLGRSRRPSSCRRPITATPCAPASSRRAATGRTSSTSISGTLRSWVGLATSARLRPDSGLQARRPHPERSDPVSADTELGPERALGFAVSIRRHRTHGPKLLRMSTMRPILDKCVMRRGQFDTEFTLRALRQGLRLAEVPSLSRPAQEPQPDDQQDRLEPDRHGSPAASDPRRTLARSFAIPSMVLGGRGIGGSGTGGR